MRHDDELCAGRVPTEERQETVDVDVVERRFDLVEDVERTGAREEDGKQERERRHRLLAAGQERQSLHFLAWRSDFDLDPIEIIPGPLVVGLPHGVDGPILLLVRRGRQRRSAEHRSRPVPLRDEAKTATASREQLRGEVLEVPGRRRERLLERLADLAIGLDDQLLELAQCGLEIPALVLELLDMCDRLGVLLLCERVDRPELFAAAGEALNALGQGLAFAIGQGLARGRGLELEDRGDAAQRGLGLGATVTCLLGPHLGDGHCLVRGVQASLQTGLRLRARTQLGSHVLARLAIVGEGGFEFAHPSGDRRGGLLQDGCQTRTEGQEPLVS